MRKATQDRVDANQPQRVRRGGYQPAEAAKVGTFASGFNSFLSTGRVSLALRLGLRHGVDREFLPRYLGLLTSNAIFAPMRVWQSMAYGGRIRREELHPEPLFLLGFWRSGTTLLHNLLSMDPRWGFVNTYQAAMPDVFLAGQRRIRRIIESRHCRPDRGVDNIPVDFSQCRRKRRSHWMCTCGLSPYTVYLHFPQARASSTLDYLFVEDRGWITGNGERVVDGESSRECCGWPATTWGASRCS